MCANFTSSGFVWTVFVLVRPRQHSAEWLDRFRKSVLSIENVIDLFRIAGNYGDMLKIVARHE